MALQAYIGSSLTYLLLLTYVPEPDPPPPAILLILHTPRTAERRPLAPPPTDAF